MDCRFCHKQIGAPGTLRQHFIRKHADAQQTRVQMHKKGDEYYCPIKGCTKKCRSPLTLKRHYYETGPHSVEELLQAGLPACITEGTPSLSLIPRSTASSRRATCSTSARESDG